MKRQWLFIGIPLGVLLQLIIECIWSPIILQNTEQLFYKIVSDLALTTLVGFFYLHVPESKRGVRSGSTIGSIIGSLTGIYLYFEIVGSVHSSINIGAMEIIRSVVLGAICGSVISMCELKFNPNRNKSVL